MRVRCATQRDRVFHPEMNYSQTQLDQLDRLTERWVADHLQKGKTSKKDKELVTLEIPLYRSKIFLILIEVFADRTYFHSILLQFHNMQGTLQSANRRQLVLVVLPSAKETSKAHRNHYQLSVPSRYLRIGLYT